MLPAIADCYPPSPAEVPPQLARPTRRYRLQTLLVVGSLFLFLAVYLSLIAISAGLCAWAAYTLTFAFEDLHEYGRFGGAVAGTLIAVGGLASGALTLFLVKGLFKF